ncbi:type II secretion system protein GspL [Marilutibacter chinensis]|uniref:Type II secretion system protein GspL n=1 Tax=Marilutibacter chinensis TaxID=2912247 RepID=A0ABS9HVB2_9GAMM|nr:type II secretion system protein GspL [Lysobacter chinensis]MCF7222623.1 type II secretion system protein GspL [Lysobacter chinensis]
MTRPTPIAIPAPAPIRLLLPAQAAPSTMCLRVDADGTVRSRETLDPRRSSAAATPPSADGLRCVLAIPGEEVRSLWLELPGRNEAQAVAAARLLLDEHLAGAEDLHVVVAPATDGSVRRQVLYLEAAVLQCRLDDARRLGFEPDAVVPDYMLLPAADDCGDVNSAGFTQVLAIDGRWLVRGRGVEFSSEVALAKAVFDTHPQATEDLRIVDMADEVEAWLARGAMHPQVDLLQHRFARHGARPQGRAAWRRAVVLAGLLLLSPLLVAATDAIRHVFAASTLRSEATETAAILAADADPATDPVAALQEAVAAGASGDRFARLHGALEAAMIAMPGLQLERLDYDGKDTLAADLSHPTADDLDALRDRLAGHGLQLEVSAGRDQDGGRVSTVVLRDTALPAAIAAEAVR